MSERSTLEVAQNLVDFINDSPTMYNAVENIGKWLESEGFKELKAIDRWELNVGEKYFVVVGSSALVAFIVKGDNIEDSGFRIIGSHSDSPTFRIKPNPEVKINDQIKLNIEPYGGMIISTWFDRPLSIAGRVLLKNQENIFKPLEYILDIDKPICIIPNLAIHMNREINDGYKYNKQEDVMPLILETGEKLETECYVKKLIQKQLKESYEMEVSLGDILDYDLFLYEYEKGSIIGENGQFISCSRLDNLASVHASLLALTDIEDANFDGVSMVSIFNHEEVGSISKEGADSRTLTNIMDRICFALKKNKEDALRSLEASFMISADLAHALHPNKSGESDPTNRPIIGEGPTIKVHAGKAYASDAYSISVYKGICNKFDIKYQEFANKSDKKSGATIGSVTSSHLPIPIIDVGIPILAMHSIRELAHIDDYMMYYKSFKYFFEI